MRELAAEPELVPPSRLLGDPRIEIPSLDVPVVDHRDESQIGPEVLADLVVVEPDIVRSRGMVPLEGDEGVVERPFRLPERRGGLAGVGGRCAEELELYLIALRHAQVEVQAGQAVEVVSAFPICNQRPDGVPAADVALVPEHGGGRCPLEGGRPRSLAAGEDQVGDIVADDVGSDRVGPSFPVSLSPHEGSRIVLVYTAPLRVLK